MKATVSKVASSRRELVKVLIGRTAHLWMIPKRGDPTPLVVSLHWPTCRDPDNWRLVHVVLETDGSELEEASARRGKNPKVRVLLHVTREQIGEIRDSFGRHGDGDTPIDIRVDNGDTDEDRDQETVH